MIASEKINKNTFMAQYGALTKNTKGTENYQLLLYREYYQVVDWLGIFSAEDVIKNK